MRPVLVVAFAVGALLAGCQKKDEFVAGFGGQGRYVGVGHYSPSRLWTQMARGAAAGNRSDATLGDDSEILVVMDSRTGELRQCGNFSGFCVRMNPWARSREQTRAAPLPLAKHVADLEAEDEAAARKAALGVKGIVGESQEKPRR